MAKCEDESRRSNFDATEDAYARLPKESFLGGGPPSPLRQSHGGALGKFTYGRIAEEGGGGRGIAANKGQGAGL